MSGRITQSLPRIIIDYAVRAGVAAKLENVDKSQVSKLLEVLWNSPEDRAIDIVVVHILRQRARNHIKSSTARFLIEGLIKIKKFVGDPKVAKPIAAEFLGLFKWIYEGLQRTRVNIRWNQLTSIGLEDLLKNIGFNV